MKNTGICFLCLFLLFISCNETTSDKSVEKSSYQEILDRGTLKVGYISYPPSFIKDPNTGKYSGIFHEAIQEIGKKLQLTIEYTEEVGWGTMIEAIKSNRVDIVCTGVWPTIERGKHVNFSNPLYYSTVKAYTAANNEQFDNDLTKINSPNVKISTLDGEMTSVIAKYDFPKAKEVSLPQSTDVSQVLLEVAQNKTDVTFVEPAIALEYMANNPNKLKEVNGVEPLRVFPNTLIVAKNEFELLSTINIGINELINNGFIDNVMSKYEKYPNSFQKVAKPFKD